MQTTKYNTFSALSLLVGRQEERTACKEIELWGAGMVQRFAYGPADATITPPSLASLKSRLV